jgi:hypothetical protein
MKQDADLAERFQNSLRYLLAERATDWLDTDAEADAEPLEVDLAHTYEDHGMLTRDKGLVVTLSDGSTVHLTITAYTER